MFSGVLQCIYQFLSAFEIYCNIIHFQRFNLTLSVVKSNCVILYGQPEEHFSISQDVVSQPVKIDTRQTVYSSTKIISVVMH